MCARSCSKAEPTPTPTNWCAAVGPGSAGPPCAFTGRIPRAHARAIRAAPTPVNCSAPACCGGRGLRGEAPVPAPTSSRARYRGQRPPTRLLHRPNRLDEATDQGSSGEIDQVPSLSRRPTRQDASSKQGSSLASLPLCDRPRRTAATLAQSDRAREFLQQAARGAIACFVPGLHWRSANGIGLPRQVLRLRPCESAR